MSHLSEAGSIYVCITTCKGFMFLLQFSMVHSINIHILLSLIHCSVCSSTTRIIAFQNTSKWNFQMYWLNWMPNWNFRLICISERFSTLVSRHLKFKSFQRQLDFRFSNKMLHLLSSTMLKPAQIYHTRIKVFRFLLSYQNYSGKCSHVSNI